MVSKMADLPDSNEIMCCEKETPAMCLTDLPVTPTTRDTAPIQIRSGRIQCDALSYVNDADGSLLASHRQPCRSGTPTRAHGVHNNNETKKTRQHHVAGPQDAENPAGCGCKRGGQKDGGGGVATARSPLLRTQNQRPKVLDQHSEHELLQMPRSA